MQVVRRWGDQTKGEVMNTAQEAIIKAVTDAWTVLSPGKRNSVASGLHGPALAEALDALVAAHECDMPTTGFDPDWPTWLCPVCKKAYQWEYYENDNRFVAWVRRPDMDRRAP